MEHIRLGKSGLSASRVGFGGIPIMRVSYAEAARCIDTAIDLGVNYIDTATGYGDSEEKIGRAIEGKRDQLLLATKAPPQTPELLMENLERSLRSLRTDYVDLYQFHNISDAGLLEKSAGLLETLEKARDQGKVRHVGATVHGVEWVNDVIRTELFETVMVALNFIVREPVSTILPIARELDVGVLAMKPMAGGHIEDARLAFKFYSEIDGVVALVGVETPEQIRQIVEIVESGEGPTEEERREMDRIRAESGDRFCRRCGYCLPCPEGVQVFPATIYQTIVSRMPPANAVAGWGADAIESAAQCVECGACVEQCPYHLDIMEIFRENRALYAKMQERHKAAAR